jgi:hypothetical protein
MQEAEARGRNTRGGRSGSYLALVALGFCIGNLNNLFSERSYIASPANCQSHFCLMKTPVLLRMARAMQRSEAREVFQIAPHARTQSERRRRLALASGFRAAANSLVMPALFLN